MATVYKVAGSRIYIGARVAGKSEVSASDFAGSPWTEVKGWATAAAIGDTQNFGTQTLISERRETPFKTTIASGSAEQSFIPIPNDPGQLLMKEAAETDSVYTIKIEWSADAALVDEVEITIASPGVFTVENGHGLEAGAPVVFTTDGTLPTGITSGTTYYVLESGLTVTDFQVAATKGGTAIVTTGTQSGVHTVTGQPVGSTDMFQSYVGDGQKSGGDATANRLKAWMLMRYSNIVEI